MIAASLVLYVLFVLESEPAIGVLFSGEGSKAGFCISVLKIVM